MPTDPQPQQVVVRNAHNKAEIEEECTKKITE